MWLALGGAADPLTDLANVRLDDSPHRLGDRPRPDQRAVHVRRTDAVVGELLERPRAEVDGAVKQHWAELTAPGVTTAQVAGCWGRVPKEADECE